MLMNRTSLVFDTCSNPKLFRCEVQTMASTLDTRENKRYNGINMFTTIRLAHMRQKLLNLTKIASSSSSFRKKNSDKNCGCEQMEKNVCVRASNGHTTKRYREKNSCLFLLHKTHLKSPKQTKSIIYLNDFGFGFFFVACLPAWLLCHFLLDTVTTTIYTPWERKHLTTMVALSEFHYYYWPTWKFYQNVFSVNTLYVWVCVLFFCCFNAMMFLSLCNFKPHIFNSFKQITFSISSGQRRAVAAFSTQKRKEEKNIQKKWSL